MKNLEPLLSGCLLLNLACSHVHITERFSTQIVQRKGSVAHHRHPAAIGFGLPTCPLFSTPDEVFAGNCTAIDQTSASARNGTYAPFENLLVARTLASPGCFLHLYCRRFRTSCVHYCGNRFARLAPQGPWLACLFGCREAALSY